MGHSTKVASIRRGEARAYLLLPAARCNREPAWQSTREGRRARSRLAPRSGTIERRIPKSGIAPPKQPRGG